MVDEERIQTFLQTMLDGFIKRAESMVKYSTLDPGYIEYIQSLERGKAVLQVHRIVKEFIERSSALYKDDLATVRGKPWYPRKWMESDPKIRKVMKQYPLVEILNYIDKRTLRPREDETIRLIAKLKQRNPTLDEKREYSVFRVDELFRGALMFTLKKNIANPKRYIQKFLAEFVEMSALMKLGKDGKAWVYSDGYFIDAPVGKKKVRFLTMKRCKKGLQEFKPKW